MEMAIAVAVGLGGSGGEADVCGGVGAAGAAAATMPDGRRGRWPRSHLPGRRAKGRRHRERRASAGDGGGGLEGETRQWRQTDERPRRDPLPMGSVSGRGGGIGR
uniref:Uncharacterized protein n=1 Tax=Oryza rufipogon TaxID=4529 RepID=A0A0E0P780_ORYRU